MFNYVRDKSSRTLYFGFLIAVFELVFLGIEVIFFGVEVSADLQGAFPSSQITSEPTFTKVATFAVSSLVLLAVSVWSLQKEFNDFTSALGLLGFFLIGALVISHLDTGVLIQELGSTQVFWYLLFLVARPIERLFASKKVYIYSIFISCFFAYLSLFSGMVLMDSGGVYLFILTFALGLAASLGFCIEELLAISLQYLFRKTGITWKFFLE